MKNEFTPILRKLQKERKQSIASLQAQIRGFKVSPIDAQKNDGVTLAVWMSKHQGKLLRMSYVTLAKRIWHIVDESQNDAEIHTALENQYLTVLIQKLKSQNEEFGKYFTKRLDAKAQKKKLDVFAIRENVDSDIRLMINTIIINTNLSENNEEYRPLISELNGILDYYKGITKIRNRKSSDKNSSHMKKMAQMELKKGLADG